MRVEVFQWSENEPIGPSWRPVSGPCFADRQSLPTVICEALGAAGATLE